MEINWKNVMGNEMETASTSVEPRFMRLWALRKKINWKNVMWRIRAGVREVTRRAQKEIKQNPPAKDRTEYAVVEARLEWNNVVSERKP